MNQNEAKGLNVDKIIQKLLDSDSKGTHFCLGERQIEGLCTTAQSIFRSEPVLLELNSPITICGDIHGQYKDLLRIFKLQGRPEDGENYLFLGDYVDRGKKSLECICLLLAYKIKFRTNFFLLRGNHECSEVNRMYGFYDQCKRRCSLKIWKAFSNCFEWIPLAAIIGYRIFCVHGGLSPAMTHLSEINRIDRPACMDRESILTDLLWSDPTGESGWHINIERGIAYTFGEDIVHSFLKKYDFDLICRSHQVVEEGYCFGKNRELVTIFSVPNYCGTFDNLGAILVVNEEMLCQLKTVKNEEVEKARFKRKLTPCPKIAIETESPQKLKKNKTWKPPSALGSLEKERRKSIFK